MSYMENLASDQIDAGIHLQAEMYKELRQDISDYLFKHKYTFGVDYFLDEYQKNANGAYVAFSVRSIIKKFKDRLEKLL